jgi:hypothetical protein
MRKNPSPAPAPPIDPKEGLAKAAKFIREAQAAGIKVAIGGGLAMNCYGLVRATKDVDLIVDRVPDVKIGGKKALSFGGVGGEMEGVQIDWICRNDERAQVYQAALEAPVMLSPWKGAERVPVVSPEWLVVMKHIAGRAKDENDLQWLLRQPGLVNRAKMKKGIRALFGAHAWMLLDALESDIFLADFSEKRDARGK